MAQSLSESDLKFLEGSETQKILLEFVWPIPLAQVTALTNLLAQACASGTLPPIKMSFIGKGLSVLIGPDKLVPSK